MKNMTRWIQENMRLIIHKFPLAYRMCLVIVRDYGKIYYKRIDKKYGYSSELRKMRGQKQGQSCFIIGNGPSLRVSDLEAIQHLDSFGSNKLYKIFSKTTWRPTYYTISDWRGLENEEINFLETENLFMGDYFFRKHKVNRKKYYVFYGHRLLDTKLSSFRFSEDISKQVYLAATVTYANLQIAMYMGYQKIYLLGMDHTYAYVKDEKGGVIRNDHVERSHFFKDDDASKNYGDMEGMTNAYIVANEYAKQQGVEIYNVTRGGALNVFERVDLDKLLDCMKVRRRIETD